MSKHTPGPWRAQIGKYHAEIRADGEYVASINANYVTPNLEEVLDETGAANARLVASAPWLLEALEDMLALYDPRVPPADAHDVVELARAALAKARGGV